MLGGAGSGEVFLAEHTKLHTRRVIKRIRKNHPFYRQLAGEADILGRLRHPGIPHLYDVEEDSQYLYLIEEFIEGTSLENMVLSNRLGERQIVHISLQICKIIQYLHQQKPPVYYLDLKPEHILLLEGNVRLIDFGSAVQIEEARTAELSQELYLGTGGYAPPELYESGTAGEYSDVYGIGSVLYFLITGRTFSGYYEEKQEAGHCSRKLWSIVRGCLQPEKKRRFSMEKLTRALERLEKTEKGSKRKKLVSQEKRLIGLVGAHPGAGVTYISLLMTFYLAEMTGLPVAYLEYNHHGDCDRFLQQRADGYASEDRRRNGRRQSGNRMLPESSRERHASLGRGADLFPEMTAEGLTALLNEDYRYYVIDFGCELEECLSEFLRCRDKIVVAQLTEWRLGDLKQFQTWEREINRQDCWHYLYNLSTDRQVRRMETDGLCFPWEGDILRPSAQAGKILTELLGWTR